MQLILDYGTDLSLIESFFPHRSRNQIKRKYRDIHQVRGKAMLREEQRKLREDRKSYVYEQSLE